MRIKKTFFAFAIVLTTMLPAAIAQVHESAVGETPRLWAGAEYSTFNPDYNHIGGRLTGVGFYADYYLTNRFGAEGEIRLLTFNKPSGQTQKSFVLGPIARIYTYRKFDLYGKFLLGAGTVNYPDNIGYGSYFELAPGGGVEYRVAPRFKIRGEYEKQFLPAAPGYVLTAPRPSSGLTPGGYSIGISYNIF